MIVSKIAQIINYKIESSSITINNYISTENLIPNFGGIMQASSLPTNKVTSFKKNDILISNIRPYFKKIWFSNIDGGCSNDVICLRIIDNRVIPKYLYYLLNTNHFIETYVSSSKGTKMPRGDKNVLLNYRFELPNLKIQQHIVDTIGSIDDLIEKYDEIIMKIVELGDLITEKTSSFSRLYELCSIELGGTPSRQKTNYWGGNNKWLNSGAATNVTVITQESEFITDMGISNSSTKFGGYGDTILSIMEPDTNKISLLSDTYYFNQSIISLRSFEETSQGAVFFGIRNAMKTIKTLKNGAAQQSINKEILINSIIPFDNKYSKNLNVLSKQLINFALSIRNLNNVKKNLLEKFFQ